MGGRKFIMTRILEKETLLDRNVNFLFGSGASMPYIPTFSTHIKKAPLSQDYADFEDILTKYPTLTDAHKHLVYFWYYHKIIKYTYLSAAHTVSPPPNYTSTYSSYLEYIQKIYNLLERKNNHTPRRVNIFTTNYDLFFEHAIDATQKSHRLILNDGGNGTIKRTLNISNFHKATLHQGTDDRYSYEIPTINLIKMHGSVSWYETDNQIGIFYPFAPYPFQNDYSLLYNSFFTGDNFLPYIKNVDELSAIIISPELTIALNNFYLEYQNIQIINPTKEKFSETVFKQHYYQSLRLLSQELERPQTILVCFGFSFSDEHIREIIQRSLSNPELHIYIYAYSHDTQFEPFLERASNVTIIRPDETYKISFEEFNKQVLR